MKFRIVANTEETRYWCQFKANTLMEYIEHWHLWRWFKDDTYFSIFDDCYLRGIKCTRESSHPDHVVIDDDRVMKKIWHKLP